MESWWQAADFAIVGEERGSVNTWTAVLVWRGELRFVTIESVERIFRDIELVWVFLCEKPSSHISAV
jgi:hypothetical protein